MVSINKHNKIDILLKQNKKVFHTNDLRLLWGVDNRQVLHNTIHRYKQRGILIPIHRGYYSVIPIDKIDPFELGSSAIHDYCYLSTESVLVIKGIIFQQIFYHTFCSAKNLRFQVGDNQYLSRQLADQYLHNPIGIIEKGNYRQATAERAIADMLYFKPKYYFDSHDTINWDKVKEIQKEVRYL